MTALHSVSGGAPAHRCRAADADALRCRERAAHAMRRKAPADTDGRPLHEALRGGARHPRG